MDNYKEIANSSLMFVLCAIVVAFTVVQSVLFMRRAWKRGLEIGMSREKLKKAVTGSMAFSVLPTLPILIILIALMAALGNYFPWLRLSVIGSSSYESVAANTVARIYGLTSYTDAGFNSTIFLSAMWAMSICILYEPILVVLGLKSLDKGLSKMRVNKPVLFGLFMTGIFTALMGWFCAPYITNLENMPQFGAFLTAGVFSLVFLWIAKKTKKGIFSEFSFPVSMILGMVMAMLIS